MRKYQKTETARTPETLRREKIEREIAIKREHDRKENANLRKVDISQTACLPGDRTGNAKDLRKDSRQSMRFDKDMSTYTYRVEPGTKYWFESVQETLAVITHARMIIASRQTREHNPIKNQYFK